MCSVNLPALACPKAVLIFCFQFVHILDQNDVLIVLMIILQMSIAVTDSVRMEEPVRWAYVCFIWHVCFILG